MYQEYVDRMCYDQESIASKDDFFNDIEKIKLMSSMNQSEMSTNLHSTFFNNLTSQSNREYLHTKDFQNLQTTE